MQGGRGHWTVNYTGTQSFINMFPYLLDLKFQKSCQAIILFALRVIFSNGVFSWVGVDKEYNSSLDLLKENYVGPVVF